jgi:hypothetical protein
MGGGWPVNPRIWWVIGITVAAVAAAVLVPAMPQSIAYHDFADHREAFGIHNFLDAASNAAFLVVGIAGLIVTLGRRAQFQFSVERWPYVMFFVGVLLTAAGSFYYHLAPDNETLFWDRLPMTIAFMALVCSQIVDRVNLRAGLALLVPMLLLGAATVIYWRATERAGAGNVVPYGILQGYSMLMLLLMAALTPSRYTRGNDLYWVFGWYALSKVLETFDAEVLGIGHVVSGHTLKHLVAAFAGVTVCLMLIRRTLVEAEPHRVAQPRPSPQPGAPSPPARRVQWPDFSAPPEHDRINLR